MIEKGDAERGGVNFPFLYRDAVAFHLSMQYPKLFSRRYPTYFCVFAVPLILLAQLWWYAVIQPSRTSAVPVVAVTVFLIWKIGPLLCISYVHANDWAENRLEANSSAQEIVMDGLKNGRIFVEPSFFDLFLPPKAISSKSSNSVLNAKAGLILFPGALVEHRAYASVAKRLSDEGIVVILFNTETFHRLPMSLLGCDLYNVRKAIVVAETKYHLTVQEWSLGGHSLGGFTAQQLVVQEPTFFRNVILWANYRPLILGNTSVNTLVIQATRDGVCESCRKDPERQQFLDSFARIRGRKKLHDIEGGNHGGFGDYAKQTFPNSDKDRTISLEAMHKEIVQVTRAFIFDSKAR